MSESDILKFRADYQVNTFPAYLFIRPDGLLILKSTGVKADGKFYLDMGKEAVRRLKTKTTLQDYDLKEKQGALNHETLKDYIKLRIRSGIYENDQLIERYVDGLTIGEFNKPEVVLLVHQAGAIYGGRALNLARANLKMVDSVYKDLPLEERISINNRIIDNTHRKAITTRDLNMEFNIDNFVRMSWSPNYRSGEKNASLKLIHYYKETNDTLNYFQTASYVYDNFFMNISADSMRRESVTHVDNLNRDSAKGSNVVTVVSVVTVSLGGNVSGDLNNAAWDYYQTGTRNPVNLFKALSWSRRAIELEPENGNYFDTLAHLFYRLGFYDEAVLNQKKAVVLMEKANWPNDKLNDFKKIITEMILRKL